MKRKALGKGLSSLIPVREVPAPEPPSTGAAQDVLQSIDLDRIRPNPKQPRETFDEEALERLAGSLRNQGMLQPIVVRSLGDGRYELVVGERRWRAAQRAGLLKVPALVREVEDAHLLEYALIENIQREELNPIEEAQAYRTLIEDLGLSQAQVAERVGKQRSTVANSLRLLTLPAAVQDSVRSGALSMGHARALAGVADPALQRALAENVIAAGLSVRQLEAAVARRARPSISRDSGGERDPNVIAAEEALQRELGTRVRIVQDSKGGRVEIFFFSDEELMRVYDLLRGAARQRA